MAQIDSDKMVMFEERCRKAGPTQTMSYSIDVYRGKIHACRDPLVFALYVSYFPQLVAGPIERAKALLPQMRHNPIIRKVDMKEIITIGMIMNI